MWSYRHRPSIRGIWGYSLAITKILHPAPFSFAILLLLIFILNAGASSSGSNLRSLVIGMGFKPSLVDKVIRERGENLGDESVDLILETLIGYSCNQKSKSESSDSLDSLFDDDDDATSHPELSTVIEPKEESVFVGGVYDEKRASLQMMHFSAKDIDFAFARLGENATVDEMVDFIVAAQITEKFRKDTTDRTNNSEANIEESNDEKLFRIMDKTLRLLEMGFSENEVSSAFERFGTEVSIDELAESILAGPLAGKFVQKDKYSSSCVRENYRHITKNEEYHDIEMKNHVRSNSHGLTTVKTEDFGADASSQSSNLNRDGLQGKRPKEENFDDFPDVESNFRQFDFEDIRKGKRPKRESTDDSSSCLRSTWLEGKAATGMITKKSFGLNPSKGLNQVVAKPPFFFYGSVVNLSQESWAKISQFLYALEPEFVNSQYFSALTRKEGYVHNLPTENRFHILPKPPMTIEDAIPHTKRWWPSWDTRKQLSCINPETSGLSPLCDRLGRILTDSRGLLSSEQQRDILHHCRSRNLIWIGQYKLAPVEPRHLESILGYPLNHTHFDDINLNERLESLRHCIQTDVLGYHLSVLKSMFPDGLTVLSFFSGIGGAEVALHRLGIRLKGVVSIETSETRRRILKRWWCNTEQTGELMQIDDIQRLTTSKLENLFAKFGGFDLLICQNPCILSTSQKSAADGENLPGFDFSLFYEFVRILQRVRSMMERNR
ncbi:probable inactive DNA (cytosine-5)-methyltransferase DRM3 isoform X2 [Rhodamnia argentea]|uniref:DNA (cytosine-5-)-methyltransferase n=1 Tax=Rhodamnia argentea TaxID=178133 RepID=A0A8B8PYM3_9MYRT|nr:probable inactive DNA (cytosine-5)-methyltransferase DRM3 isoform X2 [Rhodamnia argentea]